MTAGSNESSRHGGNRTGSENCRHWQHDASPYRNRAHVRQRNPRERKTVRAVGPQGPFTATGQTAKALLALVAAGRDGVTALEVNSWAYRLGAYVHLLRHDCGLSIETEREPHEGGWHGRYVLRSPVSIVEPAL